MIVFPIYVDLVIQNLQADYPSTQVVCPPAQTQPVSNPWPFSAAVLHPIINMIPGAIDPRYTEWQSSNVLRYGIEQGLLRALGAIAIVGGLASLIRRRVQRLRGGLPVGDEHTVLYLDIQGLPLASTYAQELGRRGPGPPGNSGLCSSIPVWRVWTRGASASFIPRVVCRVSGSRHGRN